MLGSPDFRDLPDEASEYDVFTEDAPALPIGEARWPAEQPAGIIEALEWHQTMQGTPAWLLSLDCHWVRCTVGGWSRWLWIDAADDIHGGMSGSPIVDEDGVAIGIVGISNRP